MIRQLRSMINGIKKHENEIIFGYPWMQIGVADDLYDLDKTPEHFVPYSWRCVHASFQS